MPLIRLSLPPLPALDESGCLVGVGFRLLGRLEINLLARKAHVEVLTAFKLQELIESRAGTCIYVTKLYDKRMPVESRGRRRKNEARLL